MEDPLPNLYKGGFILKQILTCLCLFFSSNYVYADSTLKESTDYRYSQHSEEKTPGKKTPEGQIFLMVLKIFSFYLCYEMYSTLLFVIKFSEMDDARY